MTVKTAGIRHIHLLVADLDRSIRFYGDAFGMKETFRDGDDLVFLNTPGTHDSLALHLVRGDERVGESGGRHDLNILGMEALAAAIRLEADVYLSAPSPRLQAALEVEHRRVTVLR